MLVPGQGFFYRDTQGFSVVLTYLLTYRLFTHWRSIGRPQKVSIFPDPGTLSPLPPSPVLSSYNLPPHSASTFSWVAPVCAFPTDSMLEPAEWYDLSVCEACGQSMSTSSYWLSIPLAPDPLPSIGPHYWSSQATISLGFSSDTY